MSRGIPVKQRPDVACGHPTHRGAGMSLRPDPVGPVPEESPRAARAAFLHGTAWMRIRDELGPIYRDDMFAPMLSQRGRPAEAPWRLALIGVCNSPSGCLTARPPMPFEAESTGSMRLGCRPTTPASMPRCCASSALGCWPVRRSSTCSTRCLRCAVSADGCTPAAVNELTRHMCWRPSARTTPGDRP
jgi:hypothetical protein